MCKLGYSIQVRTYMCMQSTARKRISTRTCIYLTVCMNVGTWKQIKRHTTCTCVHVVQTVHTLFHYYRKECCHDTGTLFLLPTLRTCEQKMRAKDKRCNYIYIYTYESIISHAQGCQVCQNSPSSCTPSHMYMYVCGDTCTMYVLMTSFPPC